MIESMQSLGMDKFRVAFTRFLAFYSDNPSGFHDVSLRSWRYCVGARLKFWRRSRVPKKGSRDEAVEIPPARKPWYFE